jgi:hypothetical protein
MKHRLAAALLTFLLLMLTEGTTHAMQAPRAASTSATQDKGSKMDDLKSFATGGRTILESRVGDIRGDGSEGVVLVLDPPVAGAPKLGEGPAREVVLLVRDDHGRLHKVASNARLVPCSSCGGLSGDPYGYTRIERGHFTIVIGGGGREHWSDEFTFAYASDRGDWFLTGALRRVEDTDTGQQKQLDLPAKDVGKIAFEDFDPAKLPEVELP